MRLFAMAVSVIAGFASPSAALADSVAVAVIDVVAGNDGLQIVGKASALADTSVDGKLSIIRTGAAGSVNTSQGGTVTVKAGESADIARVGLSFQPGDTFEADLVLTKDGATVSQATVRVGSGG